jgi:NAD+ kinase
VKRIGLLVNLSKSESLESGKRLIAWLEAQGHRVQLQPLEAEQLGRADLAIHGGAPLGQADLLIVLGGDGTLLGAAKLVADQGPPILGINTGHLGFLTEIEDCEDLEPIGPILAGEYQLERRMMLEAAVLRDGAIVHQQLGLNEAVISRGVLPQLLQLEVSVDGAPIAQYPADGIIVSTPTGSTAYALSAGGPILAPDLNLLLLTPICSHTLGARSVVIGGDEVITIDATTRGEVLLTVDGMNPFPLAPGDRVLVRRSERSANLVRRHSYRFYDLVREKFSTRTA